MTFIPDIQTDAFTLGELNAQGVFEPAVKVSLGSNNVKPLNSQKTRLMVAFAGDSPAEIEIEPGPDCQNPEGSSIINQVMLWGRRTPDGTGRKRVTLQINRDAAGGEYALLDSTTNDPSSSDGQSNSLPLLINAGEGKGVYVGLFPADNTILVADHRSGKSARIPVDALIALLRNLRP